MARIKFKVKSIAGKALADVGIVINLKNHGLIEKTTDENGERLVVSENSSQVTNPNKDTLVRSHSYVVNKLEDNTTYEVRVTATNHLGTSKMSQTYLASTVSMQEPNVYKHKLINKPTSENKIGVEHIIDVVNKTDADGGWDVNDTRLTVDSKYAVVDGDFSTSLKCDDWDMGEIGRAPCRERV